MIIGGKQIKFTPEFGNPIHIKISGLLAQINNDSKKPMTDVLKRKIRDNKRMVVQLFRQDKFMKGK